MKFSVRVGPIRITFPVVQVTYPGPPRSNGAFPPLGPRGPVVSSWFAGRGARVRAGGR